MISTEAFTRVIQGSINCYRGKHGRSNFDIYYNTQDVSTVNLPKDIYHGSYNSTRIGTDKNINGTYKTYVTTHRYSNPSGIDIIYGITDVPGIGRSLMVSFEGSTDKRGNIDWAVNFDFEKHLIRSTYGSKKVYFHDGFFESYQSCRSFMRDLADFIVRNSLIMVLGGHSKGSADSGMAMFDLLYYLQEGYGMTVEQTDKILYWFGQAGPKFTNQAGKESIERRSNNLYHLFVEGDIVPMMPPFWYSHIGRQIPYKYPLFPYHNVVKHSPWLLQCLVNDYKPSIGEVLRAEGVCK